MRIPGVDTGLLLIALMLWAEVRMYTAKMKILWVLPKSSSEPPVLPRIGPPLAPSVQALPIYNKVEETPPKAVCPPSLRGGGAEGYPSGGLTDSPHTRHGRPSAR